MPFPAAKMMPFKFISIDLFGSVSNFFDYKIYAITITFNRGCGLNLFFYDCFTVEVFILFGFATMSSSLDTSPPFYLGRP